jgi:hypothetical protein
VREAVRLVVAVQVPGRRGERRVGAAPEHDAVLLLGHGLHGGPGLGAERLARHAFADCHHDVDDEVGVPIDGGVGVHLEERERPSLVEDAQADLRIADHRQRLAPTRHRRHEELVLVGGHVVHDRHGGPVVATPVAEDARAVRAHELASVRRKQVAIGRRGERFSSER